MSLVGTWSCHVTGGGTSSGVAVLWTVRHYNPYTLCAL